MSEKKNQSNSSAGAGGHPTDKPERIDRTDRTDGEAYARWLGSKASAVVANAVICLIHQTNYLLDQQIAGLERQFVEEGGYSEQLVTARLEKRKQNQSAQSDTTDRTDQEKPSCPLCKGFMILRTVSPEEYFL